MKILCSLPVSDEQVKRIKAVSDKITFQPNVKFDKVDTEVEVLVSFGPNITVETLDLYPNLRWVQVMSAGIDQLPLDTLAKRGIRLTNARGCHQLQMAEHVMWSMLTLARNGQSFIRQQEKRLWNPEPEIEELFGKTVCIVGAGKIGEAIAEKCRSFGMIVWGISRQGKSGQAYDRMGRLIDLEEYLRKSDIVVVLLPLTPETTGFFNEEIFSWLKDGAYFINVARGPVVNEKALLDAIKGGKIKAAALDVFHEEPLPEDSPLWALDNVLITPHIAGRSPFYFVRTFDVFVENLRAYPDFSAMDNLIDFTKGY